MKIIILLILILFLKSDLMFAGRCTGSANCRECTTCNYCRHCNLTNGNCGVCGASEKKESYNTEKWILAGCITFIGLTFYFERKKKK